MLSGSVVEDEVLTASGTAGVFADPDAGDPFYFNEATVPGAQTDD